MSRAAMSLMSMAGTTGGSPTKDALYRPGESRRKLTGFSGNMSKNNTEGVDGGIDVGKHRLLGSSVHLGHLRRSLGD
jgi:hypothetical protein